MASFPFLSACVALGGLAFAAAGAASAAHSSEAEAQEQMREECAKMHEEMKTQTGEGAMMMDEATMSPEMKEKHQMCMAMEHGPGDGEQNEEARP